MLRPPKDCPITPPNTCLHIIRKLYALKRSPRHWYEKSRSALISIGLKQNKNAPCIFSGSIIPGHPYIYVGLYVYDFIYFSASELVETEFERRIKEYQNMLVEFEGEPKKFLGMKCQKIADDESLTNHLSQEATISALVEELSLEDAKSVHTPYISGCPIDKIPYADHLPPLQITISTIATPVSCWPHQLACLWHAHFNDKD